MRRCSHLSRVGLVRGACGLVGLAVLVACGTAPPSGTSAGITSSNSSSSGAPSSGAPSSGGQPSSGPSSVTSSSGTPSAGPSTGASPTDGAPVTRPTSTKEIKVERDLEQPALVSAVRFATHQGYDRIVVDLRGDIPGYTVNWVDELVQDGSGKPIDVKGGAYLQLTITPADAHRESGDPTWVGGPIFQADLGNVTDVVKTGDFEGRVGVGIVLKHRAGFRVSAQRGPNRLVIDVAN